ncbi:MAG: hypothetical protein K6C14_01745 [Eubacterium sp.]|nr:hypothetical protein [Eubacterium sp.]
MKRLTLIITALLLLVTGISAHAAEEPPTLTAVSFNGAKIDGDFSPDIRDYTVTLDNPETPPTLESYSQSGSAELFVTYELDAARHQTGVLITLSFDGGSTQYRFKYSNPAYDSTSANNLLKDIECSLCEVYPEINDSLTNYRLYIPSDMTELNIHTVTKDINAVCEFPQSIILSADQEPVLTLTVTAANGETRAYTLQVKRLDKTSGQIKAELKNGKNSILRSELLVLSPVFFAAVISAVIGLAVVIITLGILKRRTVKAEDAEEFSFFE